MKKKVALVGGGKSRTGYAVTKQIAPLPQAILRRVKKYMEEHLHDKLSLDELARETHYSRAHFLRMFRAATGKTLINILGNAA